MPRPHARIGSGGTARTEPEGLKDLLAIFSPEQVQAIYGTGFEWAEYLGASAPWEELNAPPPPKPGG